MAQLYEVKYDLMRIPYDAAAETWGKRETVLSAADSGMSAAQPKESPDSRWLLFSLSQHGNFPIFQPTCDLYVIGLRSGARRPLTAVNGSHCEIVYLGSEDRRDVPGAAGPGGISALFRSSFPFATLGRACGPLPSR